MPVSNPFFGVAGLILGGVGRGPLSRLGPKGRPRCGRRALMAVRGRCMLLCARPGCVGLHWWWLCGARCGRGHPFAATWACGMERCAPVRGANQECDRGVAVRHNNGLAGIGGRNGFRRRAGRGCG
jgi:hypothetical protein